MTTQAEVVETVTKGKTMPGQKTMRKAWVSALRSGQFKQGANKLCSMDRHRHRKYCCLGVGAKVAALAGFPVVEALDRSDSSLGFDGDESFLSRSLMSVFGLSGFDGGYTDAYDCSRSLQDDNDDRHLNFSQIADIIESEPEGMFV